MENIKKRLLLHHIKQLVQVSDNKSPYIRLKDCNNIIVKQNLSIIVN
jgi:hypothetical protein